MEKVFPTEVSIFNVIIYTIVEFGEIFFLHPNDVNYDETLQKLKGSFFRCLFINEEGILIVEKPNTLAEFLKEVSSNKGFVLLINNRFCLKNITNYVLVKTKTNWFYEIEQNDYKNQSTTKSLLIQLP